MKEPLYVRFCENYYTAVEHLENEKRRAFFDAILRYAFTEEEPDKDSIGDDVYALFRIVRDCIRVGGSHE